LKISYHVFGDRGFKIKGEQKSLNSLPIADYDYVRQPTKSINSIVKKLLISSQVTGPRCNE
jgi:hypothetical protein